MSSEPLKVGYVPEHFATPLFLAQTQNYYAEVSPHVQVDFKPYPSGTGHMIQSLKSSEIDVAIGLTEGWIAGIKGSAQADWYKVVGKYVETPLCWAISTGAGRSDIKSVDDLRGKKIGISRIGSGSYIMSFVLAQQKEWLESGKEPFEFVILDNFKNLRNAVNSGKADAFMWEFFTTKGYYDSGEIKQIGESYTPWSSWLITAQPSLSKDSRLSSFLTAVNRAIEYFNNNNDEAMKWIASNLDYTEQDAREWRKGVRFVKDVKVVEESMVRDVLHILAKAGVVKEEDVSTEGIIMEVVKQ